MAENKSLVHHLDSKTFKPFINSRSVVLVSFVMLPISQRSRHFVPIFEQVCLSLI
jgi:hypothetical protein